MNQKRSHSCGGFTLVEIMMASSVSLMMLAGMLMTLIAQQRAFVASLYQMDAQADESRVLGYISRDLRNASSIDISAEGEQVTLTVPVSSGTTTSLNANLGLPLLSLISSGTTTTATQTITYYREGTAIIRQVGSTSQTQLSSSATQFSVSRSGVMVNVSVSFQPAYSIATNTGAANGTTINSSIYLLNSSNP